MGLGPMAGAMRAEKARFEGETLMDTRLKYRERVNAAVQEADRRAADLRRMKEILDKNPELEELLEILQRVHI